MKYQDGIYRHSVIRRGYAVISGVPLHIWLMIVGLSMPLFIVAIVISQFSADAIAINQLLNMLTLGITLLSALVMTTMVMRLFRD